MHICILTTSYPRWDGDAPRFVKDLVDRLADEQHCDITVLAPADPGAPAVEQDRRCTVRRIRYFWPAKLQRLAYGGGMIPNLKTRPMAWLNLVPFAAAFAWKTIRWGRQADLIHAQWGPLGALAVLLRPLHGRPVILTVRGADIVGRSAFSRSVTAWAVRRADAVTANAQNSFELCRLLRGTDDNLHFIPNGVSLPPAKKVAEARARRAEDSKVRLLTVGRLMPERRYDLLLRAFARISVEHPQAFLQLVGDGPERQRLEKLADQLGVSRQVHFVGQVPTQEVAEYTANADIYVSAAQNEAFGNAVLEAAACGVPVITTNVGFPATVVVDGKSGYVVPPGDEDALVGALLKFLENPEHRRAAGRLLRQHIEAMNLTWSHCAAQTAAVYRSLAEGGPS
jgi:glycosyltransferase involved in cell wall biosynthesis